MGHGASKPPLSATYEVTPRGKDSAGKQETKASEVKAEVLDDILRDAARDSRGFETPSISPNARDQPRYKLERRSNIGETPTPYPEAKASAPISRRKKIERVTSKVYNGDELDELELKLQSAIDKSRLAFRERQLYNAVQSVERNCELQDLTHKQEEDAFNAVFDLCSCISEFIVESAMMSSETTKTARLLQNQRTICKKLQTANERLDAERLANEMQKYETKAELEEYEEQCQSLSSEVESLSKSVVEKDNVIAYLEEKLQSPVKAQSPKLSGSERESDKVDVEDNPVFRIGARSTASTSMPSISGLTSAIKMASSLKKRSPSRVRSNYDYKLHGSNTSPLTSPSGTSPRQYGGVGLPRSLSSSCDERSDLSLFDQVYSSPFESSSSFADKAGVTSLGEADYKYRRTKSDSFFHSEGKPQSPRSPIPINPLFGSNNF